MEKFELTKGEYIQLIQLLKVMGWVNTGGEASFVVSQGLVKVQNIVEFRLRNKIKVGMVVEFDGQTVEVI